MSNPFLAAITAAPHMTCRQMAILHAISASPGRSTREYAAGLGINVPSVTRAMDVLEVGGLAQTLRSEVDRRKVHLHVTAAGAKLVRKTSQVAS